MSDTFGERCGPQDSATGSMYANCPGRPTWYLGGTILLCLFKVAFGTGIAAVRVRSARRLIVSFGIGSLMATLPVMLPITPRCEL